MYSTIDRYIVDFFLLNILLLWLRSLRNIYTFNALYLLHHLVVEDIFMLAIEYIGFPRHALTILFKQGYALRDAK